ncbi:MAG TPA: division/cell wall cluster transcriptional repressor MraZ [Mycobacteriales bacterium]
MFLGTHPLRLDEKGRLVLPAKWRHELAEGLVITRGQVNCLYVFPTDEFVRMSATLRQASLTNRGAQDYGRLFYGSAVDQVPDKQGRISVPSTLRTYAGLDKECVVVGANTRAEVWDAGAWEAYLREQEPTYAQLGEEVFPGF